MKIRDRNEETEKQYKLALEADPEDTDTHWNYGVLLEELGRKKEAACSTFSLWELDEFSYSVIWKSDAEKRKAVEKEWVGVRCIKKANGKYVVYQEYHGDPNEVEGSLLFPAD